MKQLFRKFIKNKWHLHSLTLPGTLLFMYLMQRNFLHLLDTGKFFQSFIAIFVSAAIAFCVEWYQGVKGYNRTPEQQKVAIGDFLVSVGASVVGVIIFWTLIY